MDEEARTPSTRSARGPDPRRCVRADARRRPPGSRPVVVPRWIQLVLLPLGDPGASRSCAPPGRVLLLFIIAGLIALLLNPFVTLLRRAAASARARGADRLSASLAVSGGVGGAAGDPDLRPGLDFQRNVPGYVDDANARARRPAGLARRQRHRRPGQRRRARTALQTIGDRVTQGSGDVVAFTRDALTLLVEASLALILIIVLASTC